MKLRLRVVGVGLAGAAILVATLRPEGRELPRGWTFAIAHGDAALAEAIQNLLLFIPFGLALALAWQRRLGVVAAGALLSCTVEFIQQWLPGRDPSVGDIVCNTISTAIGAALVWTAPRWLAVPGAPGTPPARAARQSLAVALAAAAAWLGTGWLLRPTLPTATYHDRWTPDDSGWGRYRGRILSATLGPLPLHQGPIGEGGAGHTLLVAGAPLRIVAQAGPATRRAAPLLTISDDRRRVAFYVAVRGAALLAAYRSRAMALTLEQPDLTARAALAGVQRGDTITVAVWRTAGDGGYCLARDSTAWCGLGYSIGDGWRVIFYPRTFPGWVLELLNAAWVGGALVGVGYWARRHVASAAALAIASGALFAVPPLSGLRPTPPLELLGAVAGLVMGWGLARQLRFRNRLAMARDAVGLSRYGL